MGRKRGKGMGAKRKDVKGKAWWEKEEGRETEVVEGIG